MDDIQTMSGTWYLNDLGASYPGELHFDENVNRITLDVTIPFAVAPLPEKIIRMNNILCINGQLLSGKGMLLYDCQVRNIQTVYDSHSVISFWVSYAFEGLNISNEDELKFSTAWFDFGNLLRWYNLCYYDSRIGGPGSISYTWKSESLGPINCTDNLTIQFEPSSSRTFGRGYETELTLSQTVFVKFVYSQPVLWDEIINDSIKFRRLLSYAIGQKVGLKQIVTQHPNAVYSLYGTPKEKHLSDIAVWNGTGEHENAIKWNPSNYKFTLSDIIAVNGFEKWFKNYKRIEPIIGLYLSTYEDHRLFIETIFVNLSQALEGFHSRVYAHTPKQFLLRVEQLVNGLDENRAKEVKQLLLEKDDLGKKSKLPLRNRLKDLYYADGTTFLDISGIDISEFVDNVVVTRNYYTHWFDEKNTKVIPEKQLMYYIELFLHLLDYHIMRYLGIDQSKIMDYVIRKVQDISTVRDYYFSEE